MKKYKINNFEEQLYYEKLKNGLEVFMVPLTNKKNFSCMLSVKYGGKDILFRVNDEEKRVPTGIAHFLEHKLFEQEIDPFKFYQKYGTDVNASTAIDYTNYYFIGNKSFEKGLKYLLNWIQNMKITDESVQKEKGIILEESSMHKDNPDRVLYEKIRENIYVNETSRYKVIGTDEDIKKITKEELELCYNSFYTLNNMYLIITGNINPEKALNIIKNETKDMQSKTKVEKISLTEPDSVNKEYEEINMSVEIPKVAVAYKINKEELKLLNLKPIELDIYLHILLNTALGQTSKIRQIWQEKSLFTDSFYRISEIDSHYVFEFYASSTKGKELIKELENYIKDMKIDIESFEREKKLWIAHEIRLLDNSLSTLYSVLDDLLDYKEFIPNKIEIIKKLDYKTLEQIKNMLSYENRSIVIVKNKSDNY